MSCLRLVTFIGLFCFGASLAYAREGKHPRLVRQGGQPIRLVFSDGREARMEISEAPAFPTKVSFEIVETTCTGGALPKTPCTLLNPLAFDAFRLVWSKHPRPRKLGQVVSGMGGVPLVNEDLWNIGYAGLYPRLFGHFGNLDLRCDDFSWIPGGHPAPPAKLTITSWSSELMRQNLETGLTENMAVGGAYGMHFHRIDPHTLRLTRADSWVGKDSTYSLKSFFVGDVVNLVLPDSGRPGLCQLSIKPGFQAAIDEAQAKAPTLPRHWRPLVEGSKSQKFDISHLYGFFMYHFKEGTEAQLQ